MKKTLLILPVLAMIMAVSLTATAQVEWLPNTPDDQYICASHPEPGVLYLAGDQAVYKSSDNGDSWETLFPFDSSIAGRFFGMWFDDEQTGLATCTKTGKKASSLMMDRPSLPLLFKTVDGGVSWQCIDTSHYFTNIQFSSQGSVFALESHEGALYKSVDGGLTWESVLEGSDLCDFSVVDGQVVYALHGSSYLNDWNASSQPDPIVYKSSDGGSHWTTIRPADSTRGPRVMDEIFFYEDGKGVVLGHDIMLTVNDFSTYETASAGFPSAPDGWDVQNSTLKSGFQITTASSNPFDMSGYSPIRVSRDYGLHSMSIGGAYFLCEIVGCETDTSFFIVTIDDVSRVKGYDFPNVGVPEHPAVQCQISPNPVNDILTISSEIPFTRIEVYDLQGRIVADMSNAGGHPTATVNVSSIPAGVYVLRVTDTEGREYHQKIVKK